jgi:hypothetical protein
MDTGNPFHLKHPLGEQVSLSTVYFIYRSSEKRGQDLPIWTG